MSIKFKFDVSNDFTNYDEGQPILITEELLVATFAVKICSFFLFLLAGGQPYAVPKLLLAEVVWSKYSIWRMHTHRKRFSF